MIGAVASGIATAGFAQEQVKMATITPGSSAYLVMTSMASSANINQNKFEVLVDATGSPTKDMVDAALGRLDMILTTPLNMEHMKNGTAMYQDLDSAPALSQNLGLVYWFPAGAIHTVVHADTGMARLDDIRGQKVFMGPLGSEAFNASRAWIFAATGLDAGSDYEVVDSTWGAALQGFQNREFEVHISAGIPPFAQVEKLAETANVRILGLTRAEASVESDPLNRAFGEIGRTRDVIPAAAYGDKVINSEDVYAMGTTVGVVARMDLSEEAVYEITKAFWDNLPKLTEDAPYLGSLTPDAAFAAENVALHPGAARFYKEAGWKIPRALR
ncbi:C4-dicarboxylate ABC transporter substrate-binding protein [Amylibacter marinus]|uniref:C4-dicarboxylate ABC transporter substrate-binding protein n=2 Tax=Amylibacter marinus TaxID=1475483 RepID=A0ABQ5VUU3_9RHOB|nr:C4-dicarboxylate ABC transporter substrate-binding protein [Amylibacter marinus]